ncbi:PiggyBac transposable element-derived protein 4 [Plakobranchus ocellatus]|uniref:PiggyBac transposable element-derived protein 4 n=1 Tax=Plakobranchus ocellatus TaxID=259542 RepID=A0AAV4BQI4_9GAST|nr:PiggyBac transposable element-derived protein 4 [Plakobranchus ocellatus]
MKSSCLTGATYLSLTWAPSFLCQMKSSCLTGPHSLVSCGHFFPLPDGDFLPDGGDSLYSHVGTSFFCPMGSAFLTGVTLFILMWALPSSARWDKETFGCGTIRASRKGLPAGLKTDKQLQGGDNDYRVGDDGLLFCKWMDNKAVTIASNYHGSAPTGVNCTQKNGTKEQVACSEAVRDYNMHMGGVGRYVVWLTWAEPKKQKVVASSLLWTH